MDNNPFPSNRTPDSGLSAAKPPRRAGTGAAETSPRETRPGHRSAGAARLLRDFGQDAKVAIRQWAKSPWQAGFAILALAIGIGANTGVFSVVNVLLLRSLPFRDADRLAVLANFYPPHDSAAQFHQWRKESAYLADAALFQQFDVNLSSDGKLRRARAVQVSSNFFNVIGVQPFLGRGFFPGEDGDGSGWAGASGLAVLSYDLWQGLFGGDARVLGALIRIDGTPLKIIGVASAGFDYPEHASVWTAAAYSRGNNGWETIGRLQDGMTWGSARQAFNAEVERGPDTQTSGDRVRFPPRLTPLRDHLAGPSKNASLVLMACVGLILLIACSNVANLLMARIADSTTEFSIRSALGATRGRLARQLLTECMLLSAAATVCGLFLGIWTVSMASRVQPTSLSAQNFSLLDARVLAFAAVIATLTGLVFGVLPAMYAGRAHTLGTRGLSDTRRARRTREALAAGQIALTVVLISASISVGRAFTALMRIDRGFDVKSIVTVNVSLQGTGYQGPSRRLEYFQKALARVRQIPGVRSASATEFLPIYSTSFLGAPFQMDGRPAKASATVIPVMSNYFQTMGAQVIRGREFTDDELRSNAKVVIVSERFVAEFGVGSDVVGHEIAIGKNPPRRIIGVVKGMDYMRNGKVTGDMFSQVFFPSSSPGGNFSTFVASVNGRAENSLAMIRDAIRSVDPEVPLYGVKTMQERVEEALARPRFYRTAVFCFAAFALVLAVTGVYAIVSYSIKKRTEEMGVRLALGATPSTLRNSLLTRGLILVGAGLLPGLAVAVLGQRLIGNLVEGASAFDTLVFAASSALMVATTLTAVWVATRPIVRLNAVELLRTE